MKRVLEAEIHKRLKQFELQVRFTAGQGRLGILGPSGCGKSMTLKAIAGIVKPDRGKILLRSLEHDMEHVLYDSAKRIYECPQKRRVGYLFQNYALFPNMTVEQNICAGLGKGGKKEPVREIIRRFGLEGLENQYPKRLSGGQQQRVALARCLVYHPQVLLLDEPFAAMDMFLRERLRLELAGVLRDYDGVSILVTHDRDEAFQLCENLLLMNRGKIIAAGPTKEVFANPSTVEAARLTGCKNISKIKRLGSYKVKALDWGGLELTTAREVEEDIDYIGIRAHDFEPLSVEDAAWIKEKGNLIFVEEPEVSEMPFEWHVTLKNGIWWKREKNNHIHDSRAAVPDYLLVKPSAILLLKSLKEEKCTCIF